jgi:hypothetical protein
LSHAANVPDGRIQHARESEMRAWDTHLLTPRLDYM